MNGIQPVILHFSYDIVGKDESLQFFAVGQFVKFWKLWNLVVHKEEIDDVW